MMDDTRSDFDSNDAQPSDGSDGPLKLAAIDHEEYDALADLFLGDGGYAPEPIDAAKEIESESDQAEPFIVEVDDIGRSPELPNHETHTPVLQLTRHEDDAELSDLPSFENDLGGMDDGEFEVAAAGLRVLETLEMTDARAAELLAELMGVHQGEHGSHDETDSEDEDQTERPESTVMPVPCVEVVVLGHLPVRASLWARQYACSRSREGEETVALIRAASGSTSVDLISGGEPIRTRSYAHLQGALQAVSDFADRVVLRVDEGSEPALLERAEIDEITILTGADEAAVVASYRLIKTLDATLGEQFGNDKRNETGPSLRLAVMGASVEQASDACMKLENAVETFIERDVEIVVGSGRIDATGTTNLYRDSVAHPPSHILDGLVEAARCDAREEDHQLVEFPSAGVEMPELIHAKPISKPIENPANKPERTKQNAPKINDGLCALIPGLETIETRCPKAAGVEMGIDEDGRLHLVVCDDDTADAMNRLLAAQTWARNNFGLLVRAESGLALPSSDRDVETDATMHLISAEPRGVVEIYDTAVRVYALARVRIGNVIAQVATPIN